jgi:hypothetical protein
MLQVRLFPKPNTSTQSGVLDEADAQRQPYWPELEELARPAREHRRLAPETRSQIILSLCARAPLSVKELSILLNRSEAYVGDAIRPLVNSGELTFLYPDQPRHPRQKYVAGERVAQAEVTNVLDVEPELLEPPPMRRRVIAAKAGVRSSARPTQTAGVLAEAATGNLPNQWTNIAYVSAIGLLLGLTAFSLWWLVALAAAVGLSWLHIARDSAQYRKFSALSVMPSRVHGFMLLKSTVAFLEIFIVYAVVRALTGSA